MPFLILAFALTGWAQQPVQVLHGHVLPEITNGQVQFVAHLPSTQKLYFSLVLSLRNEAELHSLIQDLYDPSSPNYHQFLNTEQFAARFSPTPEDYQAVVDFVRTKGFTVTSTPDHRLTVSALGTAAQIEDAFNVTMNVYQHPTENRLFFSPDREPSLPASLPVTYISGLNNFSIPRPALSKSNSVVNATGSGPNGWFVPNDMRAAYYGGSSMTGSGQCIGLAEFEGYAINDVVGTLSYNTAASAVPNGGNYILTYTVPNGGGTFNVPITNVLLNGGTVNEYVNDTSPYKYQNEAEVVLDIAQAIGMAPGASQIRVYIVPDAWTTSGNYEFPSNSDDAAIFSQMAADSCSQFSISWNWSPEPQNLYSNDTIFQEMITTGQGLFAASGDSGSWNSTPTPYVYPEEDANVTAVGGTELTTSGSGGSWVSETAWPYSGGGISPDHVPIPSYQSGLNGVNGASTVYRNGPDVAAEANVDNYVCSYYYGCLTYSWGGTSFAAPRWAGFTALVNQQNLANGNPTIGFINPLIYPIGLSSSYKNYFHDITQGCQINNGHCAGTGYDLVTGWGSPLGSGWFPNPPHRQPQAQTPYVSNGGFSMNGYNTATWWFTLQDATPGATIYYQGNGCEGYTNSSTYPGGTIYITCTGSTTPSPSGTMYATAPGYLQSASSNW
jgi:subtilase family serine protease